MTHTHLSATPLVQATPRRRFLRLATLGAGAALFAVAGLRSAHAASDKPLDALLLSCMDYRLMDDVERYMDGRGLADKYDHVILAGASLGAITDVYPTWQQTFWDHVDIAIQLHNIQRVILLDHRDCGAYKVLLGDAHLASPDIEKATHAEQLTILKQRINAKHPKLAVETLLMALDGSVEVLEV